MNQRRTFLDRVQRLVVKVGSQVVAPAGRLDESAIDNLCSGLLKLRQRDLEVVLVTSGAVAAGRRQLGLEERPRSIPLKQASAAVGQPLIVQSYSERLLPRGQKVAQILLTAADMADRQRFLNARNTISTLLAIDVLPVVNENDTVAVEELKLGDNDRLSALVTNLVEAQLLVLLTDVEGFFDADPHRDPEARRYDFIASVGEEHFRRAGPTSTEVGLGGMATKLEAARQAARSGASTVIAGGGQENVLERILDGDDIGTWIAAGRGIGARRHWIAYSSEQRGRLTIDEGAIVALRDGGKSLLPSGIVAVDGDFVRGDMVVIVSPSGSEIGRGLAGYSATDLERIRGCHSERIEELLGYKYFDEAVHRDNLVLVEAT